MPSGSIECLPCMAPRIDEEHPQSTKSRALRVASFAPHEAAIQAICAPIGSIITPARSFRATSGPYSSATSTSKAKM